MNRLFLCLAASILVTASAPAQPSQALFDSDGRVMEYKADVEMRAGNIDDVFNASAEKGWRPRFVFSERGRFRLLFARAEDGEYEPMEYKAETLIFADDIADRFVEMAEGGWRPLFVFPAGLRYRLIFEREKNPALHVDREYRADTIDRTREVEDKFNQHAGDGWRAMFLLSATDSTEIRMLFGREHGSDGRGFRYRSQRVRSSRQLDDAFNVLAAEGWRPVFTFPDKEEYRMLFERPMEDDDTRLEYRADLIEEARDIDDAFNRFAAEGWEPVNVFREESRMRYRILFERRAVNGSDAPAGNTR